MSVSAARGYMQNYADAYGYTIVTPRRDHRKET